MGEHGATAILVAGMHRSGTSALAGALGKLGIPLGERLLEPGDDNPKGYWEHRDLVAIHEHLLAAFGYRWDDVRPLPTDWLTSDPARAAADAIGAVITRDFATERVWAVKDPRLCRLLPLWLEVLRHHDVRPVVLLMVREPGEVAASIETRNGWRCAIGEMLWLRYVTEAAAASGEVPRGVLLYDDLLEAPLSTICDILKALDVHFGPPPVHARKSLIEFVERAQRHQIHSSTGESLTKIGAIAEAIYVSLASIAHGEDTWALVRQGAAEFEKYWQREGSGLEALAGMAAKLASDAESERAEKKTLLSKFTAQVRWSEEAQARQETLQRENAELSSKLAAQVRWSEEAQTRQEILQRENAELSSKLAAQIRWSEEAQADREALRAANMGLESRVASQKSLLAKARVQRDVLRTDKHHLSVELQQAILENSRACQELAAQLQENTNKCDQINTELGYVRNRCARVEAELGAVYDSVSWKLTKPLRAVARMFRGKAEQRVR